MSVFYRPAKKRWIVSYPVAPNVWRQKVCPALVTTKRQAEAFEADVVARLRAGGDIAARRARGEEPTIGELAIRWRKLRALAVKDGKLAPSTVGDNGSHLDARILPAWKDRHVSTITTGELREWIRTTRAQVAPYTCRNTVATFRLFLEDCLAEGWVNLPANPLKHPGIDREMPTGRTLSGIVIHLTPAQADAVLRCQRVPTDRRIRYAVAFATGLRDGELAGLQVGDVDLDAVPPRLRVARALRLVGGIGTTKTQAGLRLVPLCPLAAVALRLWLDRFLPVLLTRDPLPGDPLFPGPSGGTWRDDHAAETFRHDLRAAQQDDKCKGHPVDFHATRRSFASYCKPKSAGF